MNANDDRTNEASDPSKGQTPGETEAKATEAASGESHESVIEPILSKPDESPRESASVPRLVLAPWLDGFEKQAAEAKTTRRFDVVGIAATLAAIAFLGVAAIAGVDHMRQTALVAGKAQENQDLVESVAALKTRIEAIEAVRSQEQTAELRKTLTEIRASAATAQSYGVSFGQLAQRVDRLEKDQNARLDKLAERIDQSASSRTAEIVSKLDKLEKKPAAVALAAPPPPPPSPAKTQPPPMPNVSNDVTGSIDKPKPILRGYALEDIRDGMALIESRDGPFSVSPGDVLPGAGRVLKIERRGRDWVVVTSLGIITTPPEP